jgi:hydrophobic/amphiphilic exporter-1 (mainly G- bacteria), HAE1 family
MFSRFFINRPIFACVISIIIMILGGVTIPFLPVEQTPDITPPTVVVETTYPGASAEVVQETVAVPIEEQVNGVEDMIYMSSKSSDDGKYELTVTFEVGTDIDMATVLVQNRVAIAMPKLPEETKKEGVKTEKRSTNMVLMVNLTSEKDEKGKPRYDELYLSNFATQRIKDVLARVPGVGKVQIMGAKDFGMRFWLDPNKMKARGLTTAEVSDAIREQNVQVAAGRIGAPPTEADQQFQYTVNTLGRLTDAEQFQDMVLKVGDERRVVRAKDVARVELGAQSYDWEVQLNGDPSIAIAIYQLPGANALEVRNGIEQRMIELKEDFPNGMDYVMAYDTTMFVKASISEVIETLFIAVILVVLTVYIFLQDLRTTLIPAVTIPVALIGTFAVMMGLGMSINTLSLFGLVLAIGIVVDDAIVVVENTMRLIDTEGLSAKEATSKAMLEVTGPVVATTLVLLAVFVPTAVMSGITGRLYAQFSMTIATATVFSSINALTLSPALCGMLLRPSNSEKKGRDIPILGLPLKLLDAFFAAFNKVFDVTTKGYTGIVGFTIRRAFISFLLLMGMMVAMGYGFMNLPTGFIPDEDQGYFIVNAQLPDGATLPRTKKVLEEIDAILKETDGVKDRISVEGYSALDSLVTTNAGCVFVVLENWADRPDPDLHAAALVQEIQPKLAKLRASISFAFLPPPITGLGNAGGFEYRLQDQGGKGLVELQKNGDALVATSVENPRLSRLNNNFRATVPQIYLDVDRLKVKKMGIPLQTVFATLQTYLGSAYVNDFNRDGRVYRVMMQADSEYRSSTKDIERLDVRNPAGRMVPLSTVVDIRDWAGPKTIYRYNMFPASTITGQPGLGFSSGQAVQAMEAMSDEVLPPGMGYEWSGVTYQQIVAGNQAPYIFTFAIILVYLFLAAQYESWSIPFAVIFSVPLALLGAILATWARGFDNNIYTQIGIVLLIGLAAKTAILIVEFAKQKHEEGLSVRDAAVEAARLRFRAILMTAFSFILGVLPLVVAAGAGAASRQSLGTAVAGGMTAATVLGIFFIPVSYYVVQRTSEWARNMGEK